MPVEHLTVSRVRELLERHGLRLRRSLGQHFLVDPNTARRIVRLAGLSTDDVVLEIGPGLGSLTVLLSKAVARVVAVELDERMAAALDEVVADAGNVEIVVADAVRADLQSMAAGEAVLVANLPYNVATPVFAHVLEDVPAVGRGLVMVQRELGERWTARPGTKAYGSITVKAAYFAETKIAGRVPRSVFMPPPSVDSVLVAFRRRPPPVEVGEGFFPFVESAFGHRRKTIRNALLAAGWDRSLVEAAPVDPMLRPEQLDLRAWAELHEAMS